MVYSTDVIILKMALFTVYKGCTQSSCVELILYVYSKNSGIFKFVVFDKLLRSKDISHENHAILHRDLLKMAEF